jgi:short-subunit dehydrogenase involved in D-alanine esterification of teichoic acids
MRTTDHKVLITGGSTGIGLALARAFHERDNAVLICGRRAERLAEAENALPGLHTVQADIARDDDLKRLVDTVEEALGGLTLLINNAGIQFNDEYPTAEPRQVTAHVEQEVAVNLTGPIKLTTMCMPLLKAGAPSAIVNVTSVLALAPKKSAPVYCATKAGLRSFSKALRYQLEEAGLDIAVFDVLPPRVDTEMTRARRGPKLAAHRVAEALLKAMEADRYDVRVGFTKTVARVQRLMPGLTERMIRKW